MNRTDVDLYTPLHRLAEIYDPSRHASVAALLLDHGADPNASQPALDGSPPPQGHFPNALNISKRSHTAFKRQQLHPKRRRHSRTTGEVAPR